MTLTELLHFQADILDNSRQDPVISQTDEPLGISGWRLLSTVGILHLYAFDPEPTVAEERLPFEDVSVSILLAEDSEPIEGYVVGRNGRTVLVQTFEPLMGAPSSLTMVADASGFLETASRRLQTIAAKPEAFSLAPAERLLPWLDPELPDAEREARTRVATSTLLTIWNEDAVPRRSQLATTAVDLVRSNKRLLIVCRHHGDADALTGIVGRALRAVNLPFKSLLSRYEAAIATQAAGLPLTELGFEAQMHQFYAKSRADKAALRKKYERFRELTPILAFKADRQKDLDEVKLLEWRLLTAISEHQAKIKEIDAMLAEYEQLPIWKRLTFQAVGKNAQSLPEYRHIHEEQIRELMAEVETAQARIAELKPQAAIPKEMRPEYEELKEEVSRLGGTKKIRELLAAEEGTNRQAFIQNKRVVITTAARIASDPLFARVRFDALLVDQAPLIPSSYLLAAAALIRERIVLSGDQREIGDRRAWASPFHGHADAERDSPPRATLTP